eukprot:4940106-Amphidinium_carterae.1
MLYKVLPRAEKAAQVGFYLPSHSYLREVVAVTHKGPPTLECKCRLVSESLWGCVREVWVELDNSNLKIIQQTAWS